MFTITLAQVILVCGLYLTLYVLYLNSHGNTINSDAGLNVKQLINKYGYPFENHTVFTKDGYILELHRIPYGRKHANSKRLPILVVHGLLASSVDWINTGSEKGLGYILADHGYDVWLANCRGTIWSRKHIQLDPDKDRSSFWNFSFQEIGYYDLPRLIDYILLTTNHSKLFYIGHSQGAMSFLVLASEKPEYNEKIQLATLLGPVAYLKHSTSFYIKLFANCYDKLQVAVEHFQLYEMPRPNPLIGWIGRTFCNDYSFIQEMCANAFHLAAGYSNQFNKTLMPVILSNSPAGGSTREILHSTQLYLSGTFQHYDYGQEENRRQYGQIQPPKFNVSTITTPIAIYCGSEDVFAPKEDLNRILSELHSVVEYEYIEGFGHADYIWGIDSDKVIYNNLLRVLNKYL